MVEIRNSSATRVRDLARPYLLGQLSDLHLGKKPKDGADPTSSLEVVLAGWPGCRTRSTRSSSPATSRTTASARSTG
jgi:hypothetical protein